MSWESDIFYVCMHRNTREGNFKEKLQHNEFTYAQHTLDDVCCSTKTVGNIVKIKQGSAGVLLPLKHTRPECVASRGKLQQNLSKKQHNSRITSRILDALKLGGNEIDFCF